MARGEAQAAQRRDGDQAGDLEQRARTISARQQARRRRRDRKRVRAVPFAKSGVSRDSRSLLHNARVRLAQPARVRDGANHATRLAPAPREPPGGLGQRAGEDIRPIRPIRPFSNRRAAKRQARVHRRREQSELAPTPTRALCEREQMHEREPRREHRLRERERERARRRRRRLGGQQHRRRVAAPDRPPGPRARPPGGGAEPSSPATHPAAETAPESRRAPRRPARVATPPAKSAPAAASASRWSRCAARPCVTQACPRSNALSNVSAHEASARPQVAGGPPNGAATARIAGQGALGQISGSEARSRPSPPRVSAGSPSKGAATHAQSRADPYSASSSSVTVSSRERYPAESRGRPADVSARRALRVPSSRGARSGPRHPTAGAPPRLAPPRAPAKHPAAGGPSADPADIRPGVTSPPSGARGGADWIVCLGNFSRRPSFSAPINEPMHFDRYVGQFQSF